MYLTTILSLVTSFALTQAGPTSSTLHPRQTTDPYTGYIFAYFTGNTLTGENIFLAASNGNNALDWTELNAGQPIITSTKGSRGLRDPFILRANTGDKFYLLATDLSIGSGTSWDEAQRNGSRYIEIWESEDLVNWGQQRHTLVSPPEAGMTWAPEAFWDEGAEEYVVYWASKLYAEDDPGHTANTYARQVFATTKDFVTFSDIEVWVDSSRIDSSVIQDSDGTYYRFSKEEGQGEIIQEASPSLRATKPPDTNWPVINDGIAASTGLGDIEGPTAFKANEGDVNGEKVYLFVDQYAGSGYTAVETESLAGPEWVVSAGQNLPGSPRHGTVLPVTQAELERVIGAFGEA